MYNSCIQKTIGSVVLFLVGSCGVVSTTIVSAHGEETHDGLLPKITICHALSEVEKERCYIALCEETSRAICAEDIVSVTVEGSGTEVAIAVLNDLANTKAFEGSHIQYLMERVGSTQQNDEQEEQHEEGKGETGEMKKVWWQKVVHFIYSLFVRQDMQKKEVSDHEKETEVGDSTTTHAIVEYTDGVYRPETTTIKKGETVTWVNKGLEFWPASDFHPIHRNYPGSNIVKCGTEEEKTLFDACRSMGPGAQYSFTFTEVGEWEFHDHINPRAKGKIIVVE